MMGFRGKEKRTALDWRILRVEPTGSKDFGPCSCCGNMSRTVRGFVHSPKTTLAAYFVQWTLNAPEHGATFDLIVGNWGEDAGAQDRQAVSLAYRLLEGEGSFMVIDADSRPVADPSIADRALRRDQVIGTSLADDVFAIVDAVFMKEDRIEEVRSWSRLRPA
jgi:hypothetical protein